MARTLKSMPAGAKLSISPIAGALGAEIAGVNLTRPLDADMRQQISTRSAIISSSISRTSH